MDSSPLPPGFKIVGTINPVPGAAANPSPVGLAQGGESAEAAASSAAPGGGLVSQADVARKRGILPGTIRPQETIDRETGAPADVRMLAGGIDKVEDKVATVKRRLEMTSGKPVDVFTEPGFPDVILLRDPETGVLTQVNPPGLDVGDLPSLTREAFQGVVGGGAATLGGMGGLLAGGPPGAIAGAMAGGAIGTAGGEELFNKGMRRLGLVDTRTAAENVLDTTIIGITGGLGEGVGAVGGPALREGVKRVFRGGRAGPEGALQAIDDLARFDAFPSVAQATGRAFNDGLESVLANTPGGAGRFRNVVRETTDRIQRSLDAKVQKLTGRGAVEPETAGTAVKKGLAAFVDDFTTRGGANYDRLDRFIPARTAVSTQNTMSALQALTGKIKSLPELNEFLTSPFMRGFGERLPNRQLSYAELKALRSEVGRRVASKDLISDAPKAELDRLYGAITEDMKLAAQRAGPQAEAALKRANKFWSAGRARIDDILQPLVNASEGIGENVFQMLESSSRLGGTRIRAVMRSLNAEQQRVLAGTFIKRLGRARLGQLDELEEAFSFETFLTNWNTLDRKAKETLFGGPALRGMKADLDALARASERVRESAQAFKNPPATGAAGLAGTASFAGATAATLGVAGPKELLFVPAAIALGALGANVTARLMTNRGFVRWLASSTKVKPAGWAAHMGRLAGVAGISDRETKEAIRELVQTFREPNSPPSGAAAPRQP